MDYNEAMVRETLWRSRLYKDNRNERARKTGVSEGTLRRWEGQYGPEGTWPAGPPPSFRTRPSLERFLQLDELDEEAKVVELEVMRDAALARLNGQGGAQKEG